MAKWLQLASGPHPIEAARGALDVAARLLTGNPATEADEFVLQSKATEQLGSLSDGELLRRSSRELLFVQIALCKIIASRGVFLVQEKPAETGVLLKTLAAVRAASLALRPDR